MSDRPLNVRVAEALGCKPSSRPATPWIRRERWSCGCKDRAHQCEGIDGAPGEGDEILDYDTSWEATGPLIDRFRIELWRKDMETPSEFYKAQASVLGGPCGDGDTPLLAICDLILALSEAGKLEAK